MFLPVAAGRMVCHTEMVADFCTCGAQLPPDARFCHKCGKPQYDYPGLAAEDTAPAEISIQPVAEPPAPIPEIGFHNRLAVRTGFLAAMAGVLLVIFPLPFPVVRMLIGLLAAGFLAVFLYTRRSGQILSIRGGVRMGWITGIFCFVLVGLLMTAAMLAISNEGGIANFVKTQLPPNDARADTLTQALSDPATLVGGFLFVLIFFFVLLTALPMIGGALGAKVLARE